MPKFEIIATHFFTIEFDPEMRCMYHTASPHTIDMGKDEFKKGFTISIEAVEKYRPVSYISDVRQQLMPIGPDLQIWIAENVYPRWAAAGLQKLAVVVPEDLISTLSIEQTVEEIEERTSFQMAYAVQYFTSLEEAMKWSFS